MRRRQWSIVAHGIVYTANTHPIITGGEAEYEAVLKIFRGASMQEEKLKALRALAATKIVALQEVFVDNKLQPNQSTPYRELWGSPFRMKSALKTSSMVRN